MRWAVVALNHQSIHQARVLKEQCEGMAEGIDLYTIEKYMDEDLIVIEGGLRAFNETLFKEYKAIIYIMAMGIVVRDIAPWMKHKSVDPAVLCMTVDGHYVIPVLSGHLGGANNLAKEISQATNANPVITTASDLLGKVAVDMLAKEHDLVIGSFKDAKDLTAMLINDERIQVYTDSQRTGLLGEMSIDHEIDENAQGIIYIGYKKVKMDKPMVQLIPKCLALGIGCRRDTPYEDIKALFNRIVAEGGIDRRAVKVIASIDLKKDELGIIGLSGVLNVPFKTYEAGDLADVADLFETSDFVKKTTGTGAVAMPAGYLATGKGECVVKKIAENGMTMCLWEDRR